MERDSDNSQRDSIKTVTVSAIKRVEDQLVAEIAACEHEIRGGIEDLARLKEALLSLRKQKMGNPFTKQLVQYARYSSEPNPQTDLYRPIRERAGSSASIIRSFLRSEFRKAGHPLTRTEAAKRLKDAGVEINAKDPVKRIAKVLWSSPEFVNVGDGYWLAGEPIPGSGGLGADSRRPEQGEPVLGGQGPEGSPEERAPEPNDD